jgi:glycosyltransferase involved in cell wall biosynthesis
MYNIVAPVTLKRMAQTPIEFEKKGIMLVSVGRLNVQKGFDVAIESCKILIDKGLDIYWYILGEGDERAALERKIVENGLEDRFILLGIKENPYPYVNVADIYVQPSRFEGKSIAIDEAKILAKPVVVTNFPSVADQIVHLENGFVTQMTAESIADGIAELVANSPLCDKFTKNLLAEKPDTTGEIEKLYRIIGK